MISRSSVLFLLGILHTGLSAAESVVPEGAIAANYYATAFDFSPTTADIDINSATQAKLYRGQWYKSEPRDEAIYADVDGILSMQLGGDITTRSRDLKRGILPTLSGETGFYIEVTARIKNPSPDNWPAIWLMPVEHGPQKLDAYDSGAPDVEEWMELDIDEGGFASGFYGTVHHWRGEWPKYKTKLWSTNQSSATLNRSEFHRFGVSFEPDQLRVRWWLDDLLVGSTQFPQVPSVALKQNFYLLLTAQSHGKSEPYEFQISRVRAFTMMDQTK